MTRTQHSYADMAATLGITWCPGMEPNGSYCPKAHGSSVGDISPGTVHLRDRQPGPSLQTTVTFLTLAARVLDPSLDMEYAMWRRTYRLVLAQRDLARRVHVRLPRRVFDFERAYVLAGTVGISNDVPLRKQAFDWARR